MSEHHAHELLTRICFHYLRPNQLRQFLGLSRKFRFPTVDKSFTGYAVQYWSFHYRIAEAQSDSLPGLLHHVIRENLNSACCESCGAKGISPGANTQDCTNAALGIGTQVGSEKLVRMLLEMGADPNTAVNSNGETVLHIAARAGNLSMVELFLQKGAYINPATTQADRTPLYYASAGGHPDVMKALLGARNVFSCGLNAFNDSFKCVPLCTSWNVHGLLDFKTDTLPLNNLLVVSTRDLCCQMLAFTDELSQRLWTASERLDISFGDVTSKLRKHLASDARWAHCQNEGNLALLQHAAREALIQKLLDSVGDGVWQYNDSWGVEDFSVIETVESQFLLTMQILLDVPATRDANAARNWGTALEVAVKRGQEASIRFLLEHEAVLPPNVTISIGTSSKDRHNLQIRGIDVSRRPHDVEIVPQVFMSLLADSNVTDKDSRFERNCLEWLDSKNSKFW
jgi:ankyrin repeat protein